jgi:hypothetical protein
MPDDAHIARSNGSFQDEGLNLHWFAAIAEAKPHTEGWRQA